MKDGKNSGMTNKKSTWSCDLLRVGLNDLEKKKKTRKKKKLHSSYHLPGVVFLY